MIFAVVLYCTMSRMFVAVPTTAESKIFLVHGNKMEGKVTGCYSSCDSEVKLNQVLLVTTQLVSISSLIVIIVVLYFVVNMYLARVARERVFIQDGRVDRQQPNDEEAAVRRNNVAVNGNRALPQEHEG